jgi:vancomycin resistance protein YoaR
MPNLIPVPVNPSATQAQHIDTVLEKCDSEYIALVTSGFPINDMWIENPLFALMNNPKRRLGYEPEKATNEIWAVVLAKEDMQVARRSFPDLPVRESLNAAGIVFKHPDFDEMPFQFDNLLQQAFSAEKDKNFSQAGQMFEYIAENHRNKLWMKRLAAKAFFKASDYTRAAELSHKINQQQPTVDTLLLEAKIKREKENFNSAIDLLKTAEQILENPIEHLSGNYEFPPAQALELE